MKLEPLILPDQLEGKWKNAVFLSYGVDILFFERVIWQGGWRNIILIGDGERLSESLESLERRDEIRWANKKYIVDGVFGTTFHPKMILLTNQESGRLLIGSGNLGFSGYASGGEMFVQYDYDPEYKENISAFISAKDYLSGLIAQKVIRPRTEKQFLKLFESSPWLYHGMVLESPQVVSNLEKSFLEQFALRLENESVDELLILTPFYDEQLIALSELVERLKPKTTLIYLQEGQTSIDPKSLEEFINKEKNNVQLQLIELGEDNTYVHNKLYVAKTAEKAICLQGSPNLSVSAFLRTPMVGNFELGNILVGERDEYDPLFEHLLIKKVTKPLDQLNLSYMGGNEDEVDETPALSNFCVLGVEWQEEELTIFCQGTIEDLKSLSIEIGEIQYPLEIHAINQGSLIVRLPEELQNYLSRNNIIRFVWDGNNRSIPILPINISELDKSINVSEDGEHLNSLGDLDLDDKDFEELLHELDSSLVVDGQSVVKIWRAGDQKNNDIDWDDESALRLAYDEIDYDLLRSHPKLAQYRTWNADCSSYPKTNLQIILASITSHFKGLINATVSKEDLSTTNDIEGQELSGVDREDASEVEAEEEERDRRRRNSNARKRNIMKSFVRRYIKGISSPDFLRVVDYDVVTNNYVIFSHILWRLFSFEWMDDEFVTDSALKMMQFMWGDGKEKKGYYFLIDEQGQTFCKENIIKSQGIGRLIATIYYMDYLIKQSDDKDFRLSLRNFLRHFLISNPIEITSEMLIEAWLLLGSIFVYNPPLPSQIVENFATLVSWDTEKSFLRNVEKMIGIREHSCRFSARPVSVMRPEVGETVQIFQLEILDSRGLETQERAETVCRLWMKFRTLDFYRIIDVRDQYLLFYDREFEKGTFVNKKMEIYEDVQGLEPYKDNTLDNRFRKMEQIAYQAMEKIEVKDFSFIIEL